MADISKITDLSGVTYDIKDAKARNLIPYIAGTQSSATNVWTGVAPFAALVTGQVIVYHLPVAGISTAATLELTLDTTPATTTGAIPVLMLSNSAVTTAFAAGCDIFMVYNGTAWKVSACYDALPAAPQADGHALVSVNGEWVPQNGYGYTKHDNVLPETSITVPPNQMFYVHVINGIGASVNADPINVYYDGVEYVLERHEMQSGGVTLYVYGNSTFSPSDAKFVINAIQQAGAPIQIGFNQSESGATHTIQIQQNVLTLIDNKYIDVPVKYGTGAVSTVEGASNTASGYGSHAEGVSNTASGSYTHAEGFYATASGFAAHAEGYHCTAQGDYSHSEGCESYAYDYAHAEGSGSVARGAASHAEGNTVANGAYSHTSGYHNIPDSYDDWDEWTANTSYVARDKVKRTITSSGTTFVYGHICKTANSDSTFNAEKWIDCAGRMNYVEIVGNSMSPNTNSNGRTLDWDGNGWYAGKVSVGTSANPPVPTADNDLTTKQYVDAHALPTVTAADNGKIPRVVNGAWALTTIASANGVSF